MQTQLRNSPVQETKGKQEKEEEKSWDEETPSSLWSSKDSPGNKALVKFYGMHDFVTSSIPSANVGLPRIPAYYAVLRCKYSTLVRTISSSLLWRGIENRPSHPFRPGIQVRRSLFPQAVPHTHPHTLTHDAWLTGPFFMHAVLNRGSGMSSRDDDHSGRPSHWRHRGQQHEI